ncbi:MAG: hypothetical protein IKM87_08870 [Clostridia bacterium]|nr:hypothetical protein [Clostridia bacterium]
MSKQLRMLITVLLSIFYLTVSMSIYNSNLEIYKEDQELYGYFDAILFDVPKDRITRLNNFFVRKYGLIYSQRVKVFKDSIDIAYMDDTVYALLPIKVIDGRLADKQGEICLIDTLADENGYKVNDTIAINECEYVITGLFQDRVAIWRKNPYGFRDIKLNKMPEGIISTDDSIITDPTINAVISMRKIKEYDSAVTTIYTLSHSLFYEANYDFHIYNTELVSQGNQKYYYYSSFLSLFAISTVLLIISALVLDYLLMNINESKIDEHDSPLMSIFKSIILSGTIYYVLSLFVKNGFTIAISQFVISLFLLGGINTLFFCCLEKSNLGAYLRKNRSLSCLILYISCLVSLSICIFSIYRSLYIIKDSLKTILIVCNVVFIVISICIMSYLRKTLLRRKISD